jgi:hypothetical protein
MPSAHVVARNARLRSRRDVDSSKKSVKLKRQSERPTKS